VRVWLRPLAAALGVAALWLLSRPYLGIIHDAQVYVGRAVADLDPGGVGRELDFVRDRQSAFSLFGALARPLVGALGPGRAAEVLAAAGLAAWMAGAAGLAGRLWRGWTLVGALACLAALPADYGPLSVYHYGEAFATARPFAEGAALAGLGLAAAGRPWATWALIALAAALHPLMAAPAAAVAVVVLARRERRWLWLPAAGAAAVLAAAAAGAPAAARLFQPIDPAWRAVIAARTPAVFPAAWPAASWALLACQGASLALAAGAAAAPGAEQDEAGARLRWLAGGALAVGAAGLAVTTALPTQLVVQVQPWRALWIVAALAAAAVPGMAAGLWARGPGGRLALALIACAWLLRDVTAAALPLAAASLVVGVAWRAPPRPVVLTALALAGGLAIGTTLLRLAAGPQMHGSAALGPHAAVLKWGAHAAPVALLAGLAAIARPRLGPRAALAATGLAAAALALAAWTWDDRPAFTRAVEAGRARLAWPAGPVLWVDGFGTGWLVSGRPEWWSPFQGAGVVFDRPLALEWARRRALAVQAGLAGPKARVTRAGLARICQAADGPASVAAPDRRIAADAEALVRERWTAPGAAYAVFDCRPAG
jgi:hypothetical protein